MNKKKKGISELVSYVLLIMLSIVIATGTFFWLKSLATPPENVECPDVSLWIVNYTCFVKDGRGNITFFLENRGRIDINGFKMQISETSEEPLFKDIILYNKGKTSSNKNIFLDRINSTEIVEVYGFFNAEKLELIKVVPVKMINNKQAYCKPHYFHVECNEVNSFGIT